MIADCAPIINEFKKKFSRFYNFITIYTGGILQVYAMISIHTI